MQHRTALHLVQAELVREAGGGLCEEQDGGGGGVEEPWGTLGLAVGRHVLVRV